MPKHQYGVVLDAGSSGTRIYVYKYKTAAHARAKGDAADLAALPEVETKKKWRKKVHPGISSFGPTPERVGPDHLQKLVEHALDIVPDDEVAATPIFLLATAGMRLLPNDQRADVLSNVCDYLSKETRFALPDCDVHVQVIPGETEGLYGWVAANYLLGGFKPAVEGGRGRDEHRTFGFLDMGGASAQIAFAPNVTEAEKHADDLTLLRLRKVNGEALEFGVFVTTWLGFGANEARRRYVEKLVEAYEGEHEIPDPCLPVGLIVKQDGEEIEDGEKAGDEPHLIGTGAFDECLHSTFPLLEKEKTCNNPPCLIGGVHTPAIDFDVNHFVGVSEYWHTTHEIFAMAHKDKTYDFQTYQEQVTDFCSRNWKGIEKDVDKEKWGHKVDEKTVEEVCFKASWLINMLHDGIGVPRVGLEKEKEGAGRKNTTKAIEEGAKDRGFLDPFQAVDEIDDTEVSWTLGKMVLYASSQMPPAEDAMAVGFGSNLPGPNLPSDFQHPSGHDSTPPPIAPQTPSTDSAEGEDWHDRILSTTYTRQLPGVILILIILAVALVLLTGRARRQALWIKLTGRRSGKTPTIPLFKRRKAPNFLRTKLFGHSEPSYERVVEDAALSSPTEFELGDMGPEERYTDSGETPRTGRTSGWATPAHRGLSPDVARTSPRKQSYFDLTNALPGGSSSTPGLGITPFERGGLSVRTESRETLASAVPTQGARSRASSPRRSPLVHVRKESLD